MITAYLGDLWRVAQADQSALRQVQPVGGKFRQVWSALSEKENYANG